MKLWIAVLVFLAAVAYAPDVLAQGDENVFTGTWKQNLEKSEHSPGPKPKQPAVSVLRDLPNGLQRYVKFNGCSRLQDAR